MPAPPVRKAAPSEHAAVVDTLTLAFAGDPFNRWYLPDAETFLRYFPRITDAFVDCALEHDTCFVTDRIEGVALWLPPGVTPDEAPLEAIFAEAVSPLLMEPLGQLMASFESFHPKDADCWYLPLIGVDPGCQGQGTGAALMKHATTMLDDAGVLGYLESSTPRNVPFYERHGFEVMGELPFGDGGIVTPMVRSRRA